MHESNLLNYFCRVTERETGASRQVLQFHYITWPDFGIPSTSGAFLHFLQVVRNHGVLDTATTDTDGFLEFDQGPPIVHCSAGIGRSGTFCLVDSCLLMVSSYFFTPNEPHGPFLLSSFIILILNF